MGLIANDYYLPKYFDAQIDSLAIESLNKDPYCDPQQKQVTLEIEKILQTAKRDLRTYTELAAKT